MLRFAAATKAQLRISVCQQCYCCCCCSCCCCWLPSAWLCLNSFYSIRQNSPCCTAQQLFSRSLFPSLIFSFPILSRRPELGTSTFFNLEDAVTFPRALPSSVALVYGQNGSGEEPEKENWRAKKPPFFLSFAHSSSKYDDCIPHVYCKKKNKRAHILHLFTHCVPSHHRALLKLRITVWCLWSPAEHVPSDYFSTLTTLTQFTAFTAHFSSLQRTTTTNANTTRQQVPAPSLLLICHTLYQR